MKLDAQAKAIEASRNETNRLVNEAEVANETTRNGLVARFKIGARPNPIDSRNPLLDGRINISAQNTGRATASSIKFTSTIQNRQGYRRQACSARLKKLVDKR